MSVLRWYRERGVHKVDEHDTVADAAAAQQLADHTGTAFGIAENVGGGSTTQIDRGDLVAALDSAAWGVLIKRPGHGTDAWHSAHPTQAAAQAEVDRLAAAIGDASRVRLGRVPNFE